MNVSRSMCGPHARRSWHNFWPSKAFRLA